MAIALQYRTATVNIPRKVGRAHWRTCLIRAMGGGSSVVVVNEVFTTAQREVYREVAQKRGWKHRGMSSPNIILWDPEVWTIEGKANVIRLHEGALGKRAQAFPGYNAPRYATRVVLRHKVTGEVVTHVATHLAPDGGFRMTPVWGRAMREKGRKRLSLLVERQQAKGRTVQVAGDVNTRGSLPLGHGFEWGVRGIDRIGVAPRKGLRVHMRVTRVAAPTDHKYVLRALVTLRTL